MMVHADATYFEAGMTKNEAYEQVLEQAKALFEGQRNWVCNLSNTASLLWYAYKSLGSPSNKVNWAGFYTVDAVNHDRLVLGPFQGKVACQIIHLGRGVCGTVAQKKQTLRVDDVHAFPGHIACDSESRSEIVVPVTVKEKEHTRLVAVIDIDCSSMAGFDGTDEMYLENLATLLAESCDW